MVGLIATPFENVPVQDVGGAVSAFDGAAVIFGWLFF